MEIEFRKGIALDDDLIDSVHALKQTCEGDAPDDAWRASGQQRGVADQLDRVAEACST